MPWVNVIANPASGPSSPRQARPHLVENSRENRLTPFANDPVDPTAEALFVRDDETGDAWSPTPGPMTRNPASGQFVVHHSAGVTRFSRVTRGIRHELDVLWTRRSREVLAVHTDKRRRTTRNLSVFAYNDWVLGPPRENQGGISPPRTMRRAGRSSREIPTATSSRGASHLRMPVRRRVPRRATVSRSSGATVRSPGRKPCAT